MGKKIECIIAISSRKKFEATVMCVLSHRIPWIVFPPHNQMLRPLLERFFSYTCGWNPHHPCIWGTPLATPQPLLIFHLISLCNAHFEGFIKIIAWPFTPLIFSFPHFWLIFRIRISNSLIRLLAWIVSRKETQADWPLSPNAKVHLKGEGKTAWNEEQDIAKYAFRRRIRVKHSAAKCIA